MTKKELLEMADLLEDDAEIVISFQGSIFYEWSIVEDYDDETDNIIMSITPNDFN